MFTPGNLLYFDPFHFDNGNESKPKYFLVLKVIDNGSAILVTLPSSQIHLPSNQAIAHGCLEMPDSGINCYIFRKSTPILRSGWSFPLDTFLYGNWIDDYNIAVLQEKYALEGVDYELVGELIDTEFQEIIKCFSTSQVVKRRYRRLLTEE